MTHSAHVISDSTDRIDLNFKTAIDPAMARKKATLSRKERKKSGYWYCPGTHHFGDLLLLFHSLIFLCVLCRYLFYFVHELDQLTASRSFLRR